MHSFTLIALMALATAAPLAAMEGDESHHHMAINSMCPMCSKAVGDKPSTVKITVGEGADAKTYMVACDTDTCAMMFMKNPEPVLKKAFGKEAPGAKTQYK